MENWDLQAVVRGCSANLDEAMDEFSQAPYINPCLAAPLSSFGEDDLFHDNFPHLFEATTTLDELEDLYKPFYPVLHPISPPTFLASPISVPQAEVITTGEVPKKLIKNMKESATICKKSRKNQNKRVVKEVKAEDLFSDVWAWRKYGQKPIKGSPYPRSYYRCSSSKGCSARKQVERSCSNPETFIITYTAEHNHVHPTRRNSLAGSTRSKFPSSKNKTRCNNIPSNFAQSASDAVLKEEAQVVLEEDEISHKNVMLDMMLSDEVFPSLEDLDILKLEPVMDGWFLDQFSDNFPSPWFNLGHSNTVRGAC